jgi:signal transduction histidine kinase
LLSSSLKLKRSLEQPSLTQQFLGMMALILVVGMVTIGTWVGRQIETSSIHRATSMAAIYVESILVAQRGDWSTPPLDPATHDALDRLFLTGPLQHLVVRLKFWHPDGTIFYSSDHSQIGQRLKMVPELEAAFRGEVSGHVIDVVDAEHAHERQLGSRLLEVFVPVRDPEDNEVAAAAEFYYSMADIDREIREAQQYSWLVVALATAAMWLLLHRLVRRANNTIVKQQSDLRAQLTQRNIMLADNMRMQERLREAGARTTALNERFVQRTAAHLHDGPAQDLALALLRFDSIAETCVSCASADEKRGKDVDTVRAALISSLEDLRLIASGLRIPPGMDGLSLAETVERAVREYERKYEQNVTLNIVAGSAGDKAPMAVKITAYRLIQEALANGWWHARGCAQEVRLHFAAGEVCIEVCDQGPGFDLQQAANSGRLGLALISEQVQLLAGSIDIDSVPGQGTCVKVWLPLAPEENIHV